MLIRARFFPYLALIFCSLARWFPVTAQPRLQVEKPFGYQVGDVIEKEMFVLDRDLTPHSLVSLIKPDTKVLVLVEFGGALAKVPEGKPFRGPLWCQDSFDDLAIQRAIVAAFRGAPVQVIGIAVPPVYNPVPYGYADKAFLGFSDKTSEFLENTRLFIQATEREIKSKLLPFSEVYYDPKYRLAGKLKSGEGGTNPEEHYPWEGKLRWHLDPRNYGLPIIWLIGPHGEILQEPFFSNAWDSEPPQVMYEFRDVKAAIEKYLLPPS